MKINLSYCLVKLLFVFNLTLQANESTERFRDSLKLKEISDRAWALKDSYPDSSFQLAAKALEIAKKKNFKRIEAYSLSDIGNYYKRQGNYDIAKQYFFKSLAVRLKLSDSTDAASGYNLVGIIYNNQQVYDSAIVYFKKGLSKLSNHSKYDKLRGKLFDGLSVALMRKGNFVEAQTYIGLAITKALALKDSSTLVRSWQNQGALYEQIGRTARALEYYSKAELFYRSTFNLNGLIDILINKGVVYFKRKDFAQSIASLLRAKEMSSNGFEENLSSIYNNLAIAYEGVGEYVLAKEQYLLSFQLSDSLQKPQRKVEALLNFIDLELKEGEISSSLFLINSYEGIVKKYGNITHLSKFYDYHSLALSQKGDFEKAYEVKSKADHLKDSLARIIDNAQLQAEEVERLRSEKEIAQQRSELKELSLQQEIDKQHYLLAILGLSVVLLLATSIVFYFKRRSTKQRLKLVEAERKLLLKQEQAEKKVREEIGDELHDNMTKQLSLARIKMDGLVNQLPEALSNIKEEYEGIRELLNVYYRNVRQLSHKLVKELALGSHLEKRIEELLLDIQSSSNIITHFSFDNLPEKLPEGLVDEIVAIINLTTDNVIKHSKANELSVQLYREKGFLHLTIEDNGKGFNLNKSQSNGVGLAHLQKRTKRLDAELHIESSEGKGTLIVLQIPLKKA